MSKIDNVFKQYCATHEKSQKKIKDDSFAMEVLHHLALCGIFLHENTKLQGVAGFRFNITSDPRKTRYQ